MIAWLSGVLRFRGEGHVVVDVGGVGYLVHVPAGVAGQTAVGEALELHVQTWVREDRIELYGFEAPGDRGAFEALTAVSGVGPRVALGILGAVGPAELVRAVELGDSRRLKQAPGVGKRLAERLVVDLDGKLDGVAGAEPGRPRPAAGGGPPPARSVPAEGDVWADVDSALANLEFKRREIDDALSRLRGEPPEPLDFDHLLRAALRMLGR